MTSSNFSSMPTNTDKTTLTTSMVVNNTQTMGSSNFSSMTTNTDKTTLTTSTTTTILSTATIPSDFSTSFINTKCQTLNCKNGGTFDSNSCKCSCYPSWSGTCI